jgi:hypothetical protein
MKRISTFNIFIILVLFSITLGKSTGMFSVTITTTITNNCSKKLKIEVTQHSYSVFYFKQI